MRQLNHLMKDNTKWRYKIKSWNFAFRNSERIIWKRKDVYRILLKKRNNARWNPPETKRIWWIRYQVYFSQKKRFRNWRLNQRNYLLNEMIFYPISENLNLCWMRYKIKILQLKKEEEALTSRFLLRKTDKWCTWKEKAWLRWKSFKNWK